MKEDRSVVDTFEESSAEPNGIWVDLTDPRLFHASNNFTRMEEDKYKQYSTSRIGHIEYLKTHLIEPQLTEWC